MGIVARQQIEELAARNDGDEHWFAGVCADIAAGDSLDLAYAKLCNTYAVGWSAFRTWVKADDGRERMYQDALALRAEHRRERAAANVMKIAAVEHRDEDVTPSDTLKAADMVLNPKQGFVVGAGGGSRISIEVEFVEAAGGG